MAEVVVRIGVALVALGVVAAMAVQLRGHDLLADGTALAPQPKLRAAQVKSAIADLDGAQKVRPGTQALMLKAGLELRTAQYRAASAAAKEATAKEPRNFATWVTYGLARRAVGDEAGAKQAFARSKALNPLYPTPR